MTQIDVEPLIDIQSSNPCPIFMSQTSVLQNYVLFSNSQIYVLYQILKSMAASHFLKSMSNDVTDV